MVESSSIELAKLSLEGLSVGDAFGEQFFGEPELVKSAIRHRQLPESPWHVTDDTIMALGIVEVLEQYHMINQDALARTFAVNYHLNPTRGYGGMAHRILGEISCGGDWRSISSAVFNGMGSFGNGGAMRVAPLGAYFYEDTQRVIEQARQSAEVTHAHPEGKAGAIAVALAAAFVSASAQQSTSTSGKEMLEFVAALTPESDTRSGIRTALTLPFSSPVDTVVRTLGNGSYISAPDTVPFCLWCAAKHLENYEEALWTTVSGLGDRDTTCAIVGGIVILATGGQSIPEHWLNSREPQAHWKQER
ncbi:ADP-ribosylglycohydrolase family protein [candidate division CSSED10-310 bacterium]|uniref:ADP-ribosylglycohydrolase family protein n=1 Tax=candidate division CSSED10-310 bacterium TaxID=2855610 RepID=A0ABV6Z252_UNCC1